MPALSPTMEKGNLAKWLKKEGDSVKSGDVIAEIETDKATMEVEAVDEGTLGKILVPEGTNDVAVNTPIAMITPMAKMPQASKATAAPPRSRHRLPNNRHASRRQQNRRPLRRGKSRPKKPRRQRRPRPPPSRHRPS